MNVDERLLPIDEKVGDIGFDYVDDENGGTDAMRKR
jgi:hypothetical protein